MPKYTSRLFQGVQKKSVSKSTFDLSHEWKHDINPSTYVPFLMIPTMPGDEFEINSPDFFFKFEPLYYPVIHRMNLDADLFWVPNRIMQPAVVGDPETGWTNWIMLKNETEHPTIDVDMRWHVSTILNDSIMGYMGIPYLFHEDVVRSTVITGLNAFPAMAYLMCWDQYYRNPQLEDERAFPLVAGDNTAAMIAAFGFFTPTDIRLSCLPAKWEKDYFTSALPRPQLGDAETIPQHLQVPQLTPDYAQVKITGATPDPGPLTIGAGGVLTDDTGTEVFILSDPAAEPEIRQLRIAEKIQVFRETLLKIGQRYRDYIMGFFDEDPQPMDIQVPVMIGNYKGTVQISEVLTQALGTSGDFTDYTGNYSGNASLYEQNGSTIRFKCPDHGVILGIMNVTPNTGYGQGINKYWRYSTPYDYPLDIFATVGDQEILKEELMYNNLIADTAKNQQTFGYIPKYSEAKFMSNNYGTNLAFQAGLSMHLGRWWDQETTTGTDYDEFIELDAFFVQAQRSRATGGTRIEDVWRTLVFPITLNGTMTVINAYVLHKISVKRALPLYSTPSLAG